MSRDTNIPSCDRRIRLEGAVDVLFQLCAVGCATWPELSTTRPIRFVGCTDEMVAKPEFQQQLKFPGRKIKQIMPGTWGDNQMNAEPANVIGEFTGLVSNDKVGDEVAYNIAKAFWETKDDLATIAPFAASFAIEDATFETINAIHPGSAKYLEEQGVAVRE